MTIYTADLATAEALYAAGVPAYCLAYGLLDFTADELADPAIMAAILAEDKQVASDTRRRDDYGTHLAKGSSRLFGGYCVPMTVHFPDFENMAGDLLATDPTQLAIRIVRRPTAIDLLRVADDSTMRIGVILNRDPTYIERQFIHRDPLMSVEHNELTFQASVSGPDSFGRQLLQLDNLLGQIWEAANDASAQARGWAPKFDSAVEDFNAKNVEDLQSKG